MNLSIDDYQRTNVLRNPLTIVWVISCEKCNKHHSFLHVSAKWGLGGSVRSYISAVVGGHVSFEFFEENIWF